MPRRRAGPEPMRICFHKTEGIADATLTVRGRAALDSLRGVIGSRWWDPALTADAFDAIAAGLRDAALEWDRVAPGSALVAHVARRRAAHRGVLAPVGAFAGREEASRPIQFRPSASDFVAADTGAPLVPETIDICPLSELPPGATRIVEWEDLEIGIFNCNGELFALEDRCSHDDGPLAEGELDPENCTVECPRHGSLFDLRTGKPKTLPAYVPVDTFPVRVEDDIVKLEVD